MITEQSKHQSSLLKNVDKTRLKQKKKNHKTYSPYQKIKFLVFFTKTTLFKRLVKRNPHLPIIIVQHFFQSAGLFYLCPEN